MSRRAKQRQKRGGTRAPGARNAPGPDRADGTVRRRGFRVPVALKPAIGTLVLVVAVEILLRVTGVAPSGYFKYLAEVGEARRPPNLVATNLWGSIPWVVSYDEFGLRRVKPGAAAPRPDRRIAIFGDSITEGYFVDDENTYPSLLQAMLDESFPAGGYEVINAGHGGGSIPCEYTILRKLVLPRRPKLVVVQFCTNDPLELYEKDAEGLLHHRPYEPIRRRTAMGAGRWLLVRTAIGETVFRAYLDFRSRERKQKARRVKPEVSTTVFEGATNYAANVAAYWKVARLDRVIMTEPWPPGVREFVGRYFFVLEHFLALCRENGIRMVMLYWPAYNQIYDPKASMHIRDVLRDRCAAMGIPFCDVTDACRREGRRTVLHFAPVDFHPNREGNRLIAAALFEFLRERRLLPGQEASEGK
jgi:lysophospholipase L1-like esterase